VLWLVVIALVFPLGLTISAQSAAPARDDASASVSYDVFRDRVQPMFLDKRRGLARCYVCHSQGTPFRLQRLPAGASTWDEEATRKNFDAVRRLVTPGNPDTSRLLLMPLEHEAGGTAFHPGGKRWASKNDPEWKELAQWIRNASR
jgi:hypothetical protein